MANVQTALSRIDEERKVRRDGYLLPYQVKWAFSESRLKAWEKSIRIGATYAQEFVAVRDRLMPGASDYLHSSVTLEVSKQFLRECEWWIDQYRAGAAVASRDEFSFEGVEWDPGARELVPVKKLALRITFDTGAAIIVFSSSPEGMRGLGGAVGVDEIAFHQRMAEMLKAAGGRAMRMDPVSLWSSHNGEDSEWNMFLKRERDAGDASLWWIHRTTLIDAINDGLVENINKFKKTNVSREDFIAQTRALLGSEEAYEEECLCMPKLRGMPAIPWMEILAAQGTYTIPVLDIEGDAIQGQVIDPVVEHIMAENPWRNLNPQRRYALGFDVARNGHLSSINVLDTDGRNHRLAMHIKMHNCKLPSQRELIAQGMDTLRTMTGGGDAKGLGMQTCEELQDRYPGRFDAVDFGTHKPYIVGKLKGAYADGRMTIPRSEDEIAYDVRAILIKVVGTRATFTESKNPTNKYSHCDMAYSQALAVANAEDSEGFAAAAVVVQERPGGLPRRYSGWLPQRGLRV